MNRKHSLGVLALVLSTLLTTGCFDIEQSLKFNKDMSGTAGFKLGIDFEPMITIMTAVGRQMEGKKGPVPPEELAKAKADFLKQMQSGDKSPQGDFKKEEAEMQKGLPEGVKLVDGGVEQNGFKITTHFAFSFTDPSKLALIQMPQKEGGDPTQKNVIDHPFEGFKVKDEGRTILITSKPANPAADVEKHATEDAPKAEDADSKAMEAMVKDALKGMRVAFRIEAPFKVVESNATRKEGNALLWEYNLDSLEKMQKAGTQDLGVRVRYAK